MKLIQVLHVGSSKLLCVLALYADQLKEKVVKYHSNDRNVVRALFNDSKKPALQKVVLSILTFALKIR